MLTFDSLAAGITAQGPKPEAVQAALGTGFDFQGQLKKNDQPINCNTCNLTFSLWGSQGNGTGQVGGSQTINPVPVTDGLFKVVLHSAGQFGANAFTGQDRCMRAKRKSR